MRTFFPRRRNHFFFSLLVVFTEVAAEAVRMNSSTIFDVSGSTGGTDLFFSSKKPLGRRVELAVRKGPSWKNPQEPCRREVH